MLEKLNKKMKLLFKMTQEQMWAYSARQASYAVLYYLELAVISWSKAGISWC